MAHKLKFLIIHCTATPEGRNVFPDEIRRWHTDPVEKGGRGWKQVGYSDMIMLNGVLVNLVPYNDDDLVDPWEITNGATGTNHQSRHVVYVGGTDKQMRTKDTRTAAQLATLKNYVRTMITKYPGIKVAGHNQFAKKDCPSFDVPTWLKSIGVSEQNIYRP